jgi:hypothetical protein
MSDLPLGYILLFLLVAGFLYYRFLRGKRRRGIHGRELWHQKLSERRRVRYDGAQTWEERRRRKDMYKPQWKIADRFLSKPRKSGDEDEEAGE